MDDIHYHYLGDTYNFDEYKDLDESYQVIVDMFILIYIHVEIYESSFIERYQREGGIQQRTNVYTCVHCIGIIPIRFMGKKLSSLFLHNGQTQKALLIQISVYE